MKTSGHLAHSAGIRGHSAGEFYPFRVVGKGTFTNLKWYVVKPDGTISTRGFTVVGEAFTLARHLFSIWSA